MQPLDCEKATFVGTIYAFIMSMASLSIYVAHAVIPYGLVRTLKKANYLFRYERGCMKL